MNLIWRHGSRPLPTIADEVVVVSLGGVERALRPEDIGMVELRRIFHQ